MKELKLNELTKSKFGNVERYPKEIPYKDFNWNEFMFYCGVCMYKKKAKYFGIFEECLHVSCK